MQHGYTLTELLVVIALLAIVTGVASLAIYQFYTVTSWGNAQMAVDADLRNAGLWLMHDGNESRSFTAAGTCGTFDTGRSRTYTYALNGNQLNRTDSQTGQTIVVAHRVNSVQCPAGPVTGGALAVTITSSSGKVSGTATFTVTLRVD